MQSFQRLATSWEKKSKIQQNEKDDHMHIKDEWNSLNCEWNKFNKWKKRCSYIDNLSHESIFFPDPLSFRRTHPLLLLGPHRRQNCPLQSSRLQPEWSRCGIETILGSLVRSLLEGRPSTRIVYHTSRIRPFVTVLKTRMRPVFLPAAAVSPTIDNRSGWAKATFLSENWTVDSSGSGLPQGRKVNNGSFSSSSNLSVSSSTLVIFSVLVAFVMFNLCRCDKYDSNSWNCAWLTDQFHMIFC